MRTLETLIVFLFLPLCVTAEKMTFSHITVQDGLPNNIVYNAFQDSRGFIWFCTEMGVSRYDGKTFENFTTADGLADNANFKSFEDTRHRIWFLSHNGGLCYFYQGKIFNAYNTPWLGNTSVKGSLFDVAQDTFGNVWFAAALNQVLCVTDTVVRSYQSGFLYLNDATLNKNLFLKKGRAMRYAVKTSGEMYILDLLSRKQVYTGQYNGLQKTHYRVNTGNTYIPSEKGILVLNSDRTKLISIAQPGMHTDIISCFDEDTTLWICTAGNGLWAVTEKKTEKYLDNNIVTGIMKDNEGNYWVTTLGNGVFVMKSFFNEAEIISNEYTLSLSTAPRNQDIEIISGQNNGAIKLIGKNGINTVQLSDSRYNRVLDIVTLDENNIMVCTDNELYRYNIEHNTIHKYNIESFKNYEYRFNNIWVCTLRSVFKIHDNTVTYIENDIQQKQYTAIAPLTDTTYYVGTTERLYKVMNSRSYAIAGNTLLKGGIKDMKLIGPKLWLATNGNGLFIFENDTLWRHFNVANSEIGGNFCQKIYDDRQKFVWVVTNNGLSVFNRQTGAFACNLSGATLLNSEEVKDIVTDKNYAYVATINGVKKFSLDRLFTRSKPPKVYVTHFIKNEKKIVDPGDKIKYTYVRDPISIAFTTTTFLDPRNIQYEYKFDSDEEWHSIQYPRLTFYALKPGNYTLLFRAKKYNSVWSKPTLFSITVTPTFFQSTFFKVFILLLATLAVYMIVRRRIQHVKASEAEKSKTQKRIVELENRMLTYQMNPHFIFNSLNTVQQLILVKEQSQGLSYLREFARLMRQILENSKKSLVPLTEEIDFLHRYLQLEKTRYNNKFDYTIDIAEDLKDEDIKIPPVLFQPLLENAIKHGVSTVSYGLVTLTISPGADGYIIGKVEDNGVGIYSGWESKKDKRESAALRILQERLKYIKGVQGKYGYMTITDKKDIGSRGTIITIYIPLL